MLVYFSQLITDLDGQAAQVNGGEGSKDMDLSWVCIQALLGPNELNNKCTDGVEKLKRFKLAERISAAGPAALEVTVEEVALLKQLLAASMGNLVFGRAVGLLESASTSK